MMMRTTDDDEDDDEDEMHFISTPFWDSSPSAKFGHVFMMALLNSTHWLVKQKIKPGERGLLAEGHLTVVLYAKNQRRAIAVNAANRREFHGVYL